MNSPALLVTGIGSLLAAGALVSVVLVALRSERRAVARSLAGVTSTGATVSPNSDIPFVQRVLLPALEQFSTLGRSWSPKGTVERLGRQLDLAGNPAVWSLERVLAAKALGSLGGVLLALWLLSDAGLAQVLLSAAAAGALAFFLPDLLIYNAGTKRQHQIQLSLPDSIDLLTITVEAGLGFDQALLQVARNTKGPLAGEFFRVLQEMQLGKSRSSAIRAVGERSTVSELKSFAGAMVQADQLGIPIGRVLREQAKEMRLKRRQRAEEKAMKVPVKILAPMVVFILPVIFVIVMAPAAMIISSKLG